MTHLVYTIKGLTCSGPPKTQLVRILNRPLVAGFSTHNDSFSTYYKELTCRGRPTTALVEILTSQLATKFRTCSDRRPDFLRIFISRLAQPQALWPFR